MKKKRPKVVVEGGRDGKVVDTGVVTMEVVGRGAEAGEVEPPSSPPAAPRDPCGMVAEMWARSRCRKA